MSEPTIRKPRWRKWLRRSIYAVLILVAALLAVRIVAGIVLQREYNARLEALRQSGEPLTLAEMAPPEVPSRENGGVFYMQAFAQYDLLPEKVGNRIGMLAGNNLLKPEELVEARGLLNEAGEVIRHLRKGGEVPKCWCPASDRDVDVGLPHEFLSRLQRVQACARLLRLSAQVNMEEGKSDAAVADCVQMLKLTRLLRTDAELMSLFVEIAVMDMALKQLAVVMERSEPSAAALREVMEALGDVDDRAGFVRVMKGERCSGIALYALLLRNPDRITREVRSGFFWNTFGGAVNWLWRPLWLRDAAYYLDTMGRDIEMAGIPRWKLRVPEGLAYREGYHAMTGKRWVWKPSLMWEPYIPPKLAPFDVCVARKNCAKTAMALRLYRIARGRYPERQDGLVPEFLDKVATDPFSGKPLVYRREANGFILYSVGANGVDDGGVERKGDETWVDLAWRCSR